MAKSLNLEMVNCVLLVIILILLVVCCVKQSNENFAGKDSIAAG